MAKQDKKPKLLFGQNMSARVRSPLFWTGVVGILGSAVVSFGDLIGVDLSSQVDTITANSKNIIEFVFLILGLIGVTNNPTTKHYRDAGIEQEYAKPRDDKNPNEFVQWQKNVDKEHASLREEDELLAPERKVKDVEEFDTSQPFTDDSDEVEFDVADYEDEREVALGGSKFHDDSELKDGKEDESEKDDFVENIDDVIIDDSVDSDKEDYDKEVKKKKY